MPELWGWDSVHRTLRPFYFFRFWNLTCILSVIGLFSYKFWLRHSYLRLLLYPRCSFWYCILGKHVEKGTIYIYACHLILAELNYSKCRHMLVVLKLHKNKLRTFYIRRVTSHVWNTRWQERHKNDRSRALYVQKQNNGWLIPMAAICYEIKVSSDPQPFNF